MAVTKVLGSVKISNNTYILRNPEKIYNESLQIMQPTRKQGRVWMSFKPFHYIPRKLKKNSIRDARAPQPGEIVFNTVRYRGSETVQRSGYFQRTVSYIKVQTMFK